MAIEAMLHVIAVSLMVLGCVVTLLNIFGVANAILRRKRFSCVPLLGGLTVAAGYALGPNHTARLVAAVAMIIDPISLPALLLLLYYGISGRRPPLVNDPTLRSANSVLNRQPPPDDP